jgi:hypothetical protein
VHFATVLLSGFEVGNYAGCGTGIYTNRVSGFTFEENSFTKYNGGQPANYFGISINHSEDVNDVYKNDFSGLSFANYSNGKNWLGANHYQGLEYICNTNTANFADFFVADEIFPEYSGIQSNQGNLNTPAGNTFTQSGATWHIYNGGGNQIDYYYDENSNVAIPTLIYGVTLHAVRTENQCPSRFDNNHELRLVLTPQEKYDMEMDYYTNFTDFNNTKTLFESYVDGGNTASEISDIQSAQPADMWELRAQLLGDSPHLSQEVLFAAADRTDVFTESANFSIMAANTDELKKETIIS